MKEVQYVGAHAIRMDEVALRWVVLCGVALLLLMASDVALADEASTAAKDALATSALGTALKNLVATLNGTIARSLAIIAVIGTGIAALTGRMEWSKAVVVVLGVGVIFSATALIDGLFPPAA
jgi:type IV secretory pathway VirB2 component (pilin)